MAPEYVRGELSAKVDAYAFGLVVLEALTGHSVLAPVPGRPNLMAMWEEDLDSPNKLVAHLDKRASWPEHKERVAKLHSIADRCLEPRRTRRPTLVDLIPELEEVRHGAEALPDAATDPGRECAVCLRGDAEIKGWAMLRPCGHVCVCRECAVGLSQCPKCRQAVKECIDAYLY